MSKGRYTSRRRRNTLKPLLIAMAVVLLIGCVAGGTLAWLMDTTDEVVNTFTVGDIDIELVETTGNSYKMVPGNEIAKNPTVTVEAGSEACWLFIEITETANLKDFITYSVEENWNKLEDGVYYREVGASNTDQSFPVLAGTKVVEDETINGVVTVKNSVTKAMMDGLSEANYPKLTFKAYAVQKDNVATAADAWAIAKPATPPAA